jgi:hypothetical protein
LVSEIAVKQQYGKNPEDGKDHAIETLTKKRRSPSLWNTGEKLFA